MASGNVGLSGQGSALRVGLCELIGASPEMQVIYTLMEKVSQHTFPVLILGESGTGKELVARAIHRLGARASHCFTPVDCSALTPSLVESELFGHRQGSFTGHSFHRGLVSSISQRDHFPGRGRRTSDWLAG